MDEFGNGSDQEFGGVYNAQDATSPWNRKLQLEEEVKIRSEADKLESNIMFKDDRDHALREGREVENSSWQEGQTSPPFAQVEISGEENYHLGVSGANGRRLQYWSSEEVNDASLTVLYLPSLRQNFHSFCNHGSRFKTKSISLTQWDCWLGVGCFAHNTFHVQ